MSKRNHDTANVDSDFDSPTRELTGSLTMIHRVRIPMAAPGTMNGGSVGEWLDTQIENAMRDRETIGEFTVDLSPLFTSESN